MAAKLNIKEPLRILGIQILKGTDISVRKVLDYGWYPFIKCETNIGTNTEIFPKVDSDSCPLSFFTINNETMPTVTITAIAGKNGTGKSSIIDLLYRILNNFAEVLIVPTKEDRCTKIGHACGVNARLHFELDGIQKFIQCDDYETSYFEVTDGSAAQIKIKDLTETQTKEILNGFFYTICINYSLYAFNPIENNISISHQKNNVLNCPNWLNFLFNKNDGYYVPIVLTPFREEGQIDINNENKLAEQRLTVLALLFHSQKKEFIEDYTPYHLKYNFNERYEEEKKNKLKDYPLKKEIKLIQFSLINELQKIWEKVLADKDELRPESINDKYVKTSLFYLAYKTLKICVLYSEYASLMHLEDLINFIKQKERSNSENPPRTSMDLNEMHIKAEEEGEIWIKNNVSNLLILVDKIHNTKENHITAKIQQCISFLKNEKFMQDFSELNVDNDLLKGIIYQTYDVIMQILPPAFFNTELSFLRKGTKSENAKYTLDEMTFSSMSSGERQMYYSLSYVYYHIRNIASIKDNGKRVVGYHHINLIFDEAELYYHPEYQRKFVKKLLSGLAICHINRQIIRSINIIIITHSPFILSDIPDTNILFLHKDETESSEPTKTLGANIYDLLKSGFFLDYAIGDIVQEKLNNIIKVFHLEDNEEREEIFLIKKDEFKFIIEHLGENYYKSSFLYMYKQMEQQYNKNNKTQSRDELNKQLQDLKQEQLKIERKLSEDETCNLSK